MIRLLGGKKLKKLSGMSAAIRDDPTTVLQHIDCGLEEPTPVNLANVINKAFLSPMSDFTPLPPSIPKNLFLRKLTAFNSRRKQLAQMEFLAGY